MKTMPRESVESVLMKITKNLGDPILRKDGKWVRNTGDSKIPGVFWKLYKNNSQEKAIIKKHGFKALLVPETKKYEVIFESDLPDVDFHEIILSIKLEFESMSLDGV